MTDHWVAVLFWACAGVLLYTYVGYPVLLALLASRRRAEPVPPAAPSSALPTVSVLVSAYNEEECIADKIRNTFAQDYPAHLLECIVVSDGSTDRTVEAAERVADPRLKVLVQSPNQGKCRALTRGVAEATGDVLVFTDANAMLEPRAIALLARRFADPRVGLVSGKGVFTERREGSVHVVTNTYLELEQFLREREQRFGYIVWADGALYALRRSLFQGLEPVHANDFLHPIQTVLQGYRAVLEPRAVFREDTSGSSGGEFRRQARMIGQGIHIVRTEGPKLLARGAWAAVWQLVSHRLLRWLGPVFLAGALVSSAYLAPRSGLYLVLFVLQALFYVLAALGALGERLGWRLRLLAIPYYFCLVNLAGLVGFLRAMTGNVQATWTPVRTT